MPNNTAFKAAALFLLFFPAPAFSQTQPSPQTYEQLVQAIRQTRAASEARIEAAVNAEKVREAWEIGKLIDGYILLNKERQNYGDQVVIKLAKDLGTSESELRYILQFARTYAIHPPADELSWSQHRELLSLNDPKEREEVTKEAVRNHWTRDQVRAEVRRRQARQAPAPEVLESKPGKVGGYRIVDWNGKKAYDLGFSNYYEIKGRIPNQKEPPAEDLYTYEAFVEQVIDGDGLWANIHLGFGFWTRQKLRLRGIDAAEIESSEGKEAREFLVKQFRKAKNKILIKTVKSDKYDRYLVDIWVNGNYLNQEMLNQQLAVRMEE